MSNVLKVNLPLDELNDPIVCPSIIKQISFLGPEIIVQSYFRGQIGGVTAT